MGVVIQLLPASAFARGESLEETLDESRFLQGLIEQQLPEILEHYFATHPADSDIDESRQRIARLQMNLARIEGSSAERQALLEEILDARASALEQVDDDEQRAVLLIEQAADFYFQLLPIDASGPTTLFGLPSPGQRERASRVGAEMYRLSVEAGAALDQALRRVQTRPEHPLGQERWRRLAEQERDLRLPFLLGAGAYLHARLNVEDPERRRSLYLSAAESLKPLVDRLQGALANRARLFAGLALIELGSHEEAAALFGKIDGATAGQEMDAVSARLAEVLNAAAQHGPAAGLDQLRQLESQHAAAGDLPLRLLLTDQKFLLVRRAAEQAAASDRSRGMASAIRVYLELLESDLGLPEDLVRQAVLAKLINAVDDSVPLADLPPLVTVARAVALSRDPATGDRAVELLNRTLAGNDLAEVDRATALFSLARVLYASGRKLEAVDRFTELAEQHATDANAERAAEIGAALAAQLFQQNPEDAAVQSRLGRSLDVLLRRYPNLPSIDRYRYLAGRVAMKEGRLEDARGFWSQVARDAPQWLDAQFMLAKASWMQLFAESGAGDPSRAAPAIDEIARVEHALRGELEASTDSARAGELRAYLVRLRIYLGEVLLVANRPREAIEALEGLEQDPSADSVAIASALRTRIDAYKRLGDSSASQREILEFIELAPQRVPEVVVPLLSERLNDAEALLAEGASERPKSSPGRSLRRSRSCSRTGWNRRSRRETIWTG